MGGWWGRLQRAINEDRRFGTWFMGIYAVLALILATSDRGWRQVVWLVGAALLALSTVLRARDWQRQGRWVRHASAIVLPAELREQVREQLAHGGRVAAVKLVREQTGADLTSAVRAVDGVADDAARDRPGT